MKTICSAQRTLLDMCCFPFLEPWESTLITTGLFETGLGWIFDPRLHTFVDGTRLATPLLPLSITFASFAIWKLPVKYNTLIVCLPFSINNN